MRRLALLVAVVVVVSACSGEEIEGFLDIIPESDLTQSDDPGERAAGESAVEVLTIAEAEENLERGIAEGDIDAVRQAGRLRPNDSKYDFYEAALLAGEDLGENEQAAADYHAAASRGGFNFGAQHPEVEDPLAQGRLSVEAYLDALLHVIESSPPGEANNRRIDTYCSAISGFYSQTYIDRFPQEVAFYLAVQGNLNLCP